MIVILVKLLSLYELILFIRIIMSWIQPDPYNPVVRFLHSMTDPILIPLRRIIPPLGGMIDLSPMILFILIEFLKRALLRSFYF
ncbi:MAG: YggT family protein [Candidatus Auribacterota bacterium]|uniref:YggT family protein n=1 Tax=Candidatus Auribacter fodinae TaxID=2093366 RepID=A0A3A4QWL2_9BACT|nr:MAG: YggT family protein [Candidatus Auribacter fodinae]